MNVLFFISLFLLLISITNSKLKKHYILIKSITSILFCCIALINFIQSGMNNWMILMLPIVLCMIGDVALGFYQRFKKPIFFKLGLTSFLFAHVFFVFHLHTIINIQFFEIIIALNGVLLTYLVDKFQLIHFGKQKIACMTYSFFVTLLLVKGLYIAISLKTTIAYALGLASLLFFISDFILMFMYFRKTNTVLHIFNLTTYYLSMYLFANILHH